MSSNNQTEEDQRGLKFSQLIENCQEVSYNLLFCLRSTLPPFSKDLSLTQEKAISINIPPSNFEVSSHLIFLSHSKIGKQRVLPACGYGVNLRFREAHQRV